MKTLLVYILFISTSFAKGPILYPLDSPDYDLGHMIEKCGVKLNPKSYCKDSNGFQRRNAIYREIVINAPIEQVWSIITDLNRYKVWNPFMPKLKSDFKIGGKLKFVVKLGKVIQFPEVLWTQAFEDQGSMRRWCWGNKILFKTVGYSQRCRWLRSLGKNKTLYMTTEKFKGNSAELINLMQRKVLTNGVEKEARVLKRLAEYEHEKSFYPKESKACNGEGQCIDPIYKKTDREIILFKTFKGTPKEVLSHFYEIDKIKNWLGNFNEIIPPGISKNPLGLGYVRRIKAPFVGTTDETYTIIIPNKLVRYRVTKSSFMKNHLGDHAVFPNDDDTTDLLWVIKYDSRYAHPNFQRWFIEKHLKGGLRKLERRIFSRN